MYGKIASITKGGDTTVLYTYDPGGNRISKSVVHSGDTLTTWYVRDAQGNVMSVYTYGDPAVHGKDLTQTELHIYGSNRLGIWRPNKDVYKVPLDSTILVPLLGYGDSVIFTRGNKFFELTNHLGNVLATISDKRFGVTPDSVARYYLPDVVSANDYYPFGMLQPGRGYAQSGTGYSYGFNGKEKDDEVKGIGDQIDYGMRVYDPRVGRFLSVDPLTKKYPWYTPYQFTGNSPIMNIDLDGTEPIAAGNVNLIEVNGNSTKIKVQSSVTIKVQVLNISSTPNSELNLNMVQGSIRQFGSELGGENKAMITTAFRLDFKTGKTVMLDHPNTFIEATYQTTVKIVPEIINSEDQISNDAVVIGIIDKVKAYGGDVLAAGSKYHSVAFLPASALTNDKVSTLGNKLISHELGHVFGLDDKDEDGSMKTRDRNNTTGFTDKEKTEMLKQLIGNWNILWDQKTKGKPLDIKFTSLDMKKNFEELKNLVQ